MHMCTCMQDNAGSAVLYCLHTRILYKYPHIKSDQDYLQSPKAVIDSSQTVPIWTHSLSATLRFFRLLFRNVLALPLSPMGSEGLLEKQVSEICRRFRRYQNSVFVTWFFSPEFLFSGEKCLPFFLGSIVTGVFFGAVKHRVVMLYIFLVSLVWEIGEGWPVDSCFFWASWNQFTHSPTSTGSWCQMMGNPNAGAIVISLDMLFSRRGEPCKITHELSLFTKSKQKFMNVPNNAYHCRFDVKTALMMLWKRSNYVKAKNSLIFGPAL